MTDQTGPAGHDQLSVTAADESLQVGKSRVGGVLGEFAPLCLARSEINAILEEKSNWINIFYLTRPNKDYFDYLVQNSSVQTVP